MVGQRHLLFKLFRLTHLFGASWGSFVILSFSCRHTLVLQSFDTVTTAKVISLQGALPTPGSSPLVAKCNHPSCFTCPYLITTPYIHSLRKGTTQNLGTKYSELLVSHIIYLVTCTKCGVQYVGMTTLSLRARFSQHIRDLQKDQATGVTTYKPGHLPTTSRYSQWM